MKIERTLLVVVIVALSLALALACLGSIVAIGSSPHPLVVVSPPIWQFSGFSISAEITNNPECSPLIVGCLVVPPAHSPNYFTVWGAITTYNSRGQETSARRIVKLQVP